MTAVAPPEAPTLGVVDGMDADDYHRHPALSSTGARKLLPPSCPAKFRWEQIHGQPAKRTFEFGRAAHQFVLGEGAEIAVLKYDNYRSKAAQEEAEEARAANATPLLEREWEQVEAMAEAIRHDPLAGPLFTPGRGIAERALFWTDGPTGVERRALLDWTLHRDTGQRLVITDYKTTTDASKAGVEKAIAAYGYHQQAAWYIDGAIATGIGGEDTVMVFAFQEKTPPYLVTVAEIVPDDVRRGRERNRRAINTYARCVETGHWPGHAEGVITASQPTWAQIRHDEEYA